jgi:myo-inositol-1(or 4)-monophosphatase
MGLSRLDLAKEAALEAGRLVMGYYHDEYEVREKGEDNPVTTADLEADQALRRTLLQGAPGTGWLSEETVDSAERLEAQEVWVVDPIDGTKEFIGGIPEFAISIGLASQGEMILGVLYNPPKNELFWAEKGAGAFLNGEPIQVSGRSDLDGSLLIASRSEVGRGEFEDYGTSFQVKPVGSIAYKLAQIAAGEADLTWSLGPKNEWDIAAGHCLIHEAGGKVTDPDGEPFRFNRPDPLVPGILASNGRLHGRAVQAVAEDFSRRKARRAARKAKK